MGKILAKILLGSVLAISLMMPSTVQASCDGGPDLSSCSGFEITDNANYRVYFSGFGVVAGELDGATVDIASSNMYPFVAYQYQTDYVKLTDEAKTGYDNASTHLDTLLLVTTNPVAVPPNLTDPNLSKLQKLLFLPLENYETVGVVTVKDSNNDGKPDDCVVIDPQLPITDLEKARDTFAYDVTVHTKDAFGNDQTGYPNPQQAQDNLRGSLMLLANIYTMAADEFLNDALEYRFQAVGQLQPLDDRLDFQIGLLTKAQACYNKALNSFMYGFGQAPTSGETIADYFTGTSDKNDAFWNLFNLIVERRSTAMRELSYKQLIRLMPIDPTDQATARKTSLTTLQSASSDAYLLAVAIAQRKSANFTDTGGDRLQSALALLKKQATILQQNRNPLGYDDRFVPMQDASQLLQSMDAMLNDLKTKQADLAADHTTFDSSYDELRRNMATDAGGYKLNLATLTDTNGDDLDFLNKAQDAGGDLLKCPFNADDFPTCTSDKTKGVLGNKYGMIREKFLLMQEAQLRRDNHKKAIELEVEKHNKMVRIELKYNQDVNQALDKFLVKMDKARSSVWSQIGKWATCAGSIVAAVASEGAAAPAAVSACSSAISAATYNVNDDELGIQVTKEKELQQALTDYKIAMLDATDEVVIQNMVNRLVEFEIEIGLANQQLTAAYTDFENTLKERDNLVSLYRKADAYRQYTDTKMKERIADVKILKNQHAQAYASQLNQAVHNIYLAAKTVEYQNLKPLDDIPVINKRLRITELYKAQTYDDINNFYMLLNTYRTSICSWGSIAYTSPPEFPLTISLAEDILGLTHDYLNLDGSLSSSEEDRKRTAMVQAYLSDKIDKTNNSLDFQFATSVHDPNLYKSGLTNIKIWWGPPPPGCDQLDAKGVKVQILTSQTKKIVPWVTLIQAGHSTYRKSDGSVVEYIPIRQYLNMQEIDSNKEPPLTKANFLALVNDDTTTGAGWNNEFKGRSVASSNWEMIIEDYQRYANEAPIDWSKVSDIRIYVHGYSFKEQ